MRAAYIIMHWGGMDCRANGPLIATHNVSMKEKLSLAMKLHIREVSMSKPHTGGEHEQTSYGR